MTIIKPTQEEFSEVQTQAERIIADLRSRYPTCFPEDLNAILNCLCSAIVIHIASSSKPEYYENFSNTVNTLISENLKILREAKESPS